MQMIIPTALSQLRNAYISCILNKADVPTAIIFMECMLAILPPNKNDDKNNQKPEAPTLSELSSFFEDPDDQKNMTKLWLYFSKLAPFVEKQFSMYVTNQSASKDFR